MIKSYDAEAMEYEQQSRVQEVGHQAVWSLSSCKPGFGVDQLRDPSLDTYWQSDGPQPHLVNIQFRKKMTVQELCIYADYKLDESYTPNRIAIRAGTNFNDLGDKEQLELNEPTGWIRIPLKDSRGHPLRTYMIQIAILANHQNGRDTHVRHIKVHSPFQESSALRTMVPTSVEMSQYSFIR